MIGRSGSGWRGNIFRVVWVGHSCPTPLHLVLVFILTVVSPILAQVKINSNVNGAGQECPTHTTTQLGDGREKNRDYFWDGEYVSAGVGGEDQLDEGGWG